MRLFVFGTVKASVWLLGVKMQQMVPPSCFHTEKKELA